MAELKNIADNDPHVIAEKAAHLWNNAERDGGKGDSLATFALFHAWKGGPNSIPMNFTAQILKGEEVERRFVFDLEDYVSKPCLKEDGSGRDNKATNARTLAILNDLFGLRNDQIKPAHKTRLNRAITAAHFLVKQGLKPEQVTLDKRNNVQLPLHVVQAPPHDNASDKAKRQYDATKNELFPLDGRDNMSMAQVQRRAAEFFNKGNGANTRRGSDPVASFKTSLHTVNKTIEAALNPEGESDVAFNADLRNEMFVVLQRLNKYFEADPMDMSPKTQAPKNTRGSKGDNKAA